MTWPADRGAEAVSPPEPYEVEPFGVWYCAGIGGGGGMLDREFCSRRTPWAGFAGKPREDEDEVEECCGITAVPIPPMPIIEDIC